MNRSRIILVVEADPAVLEFASRTLESQGFTVVPAEGWTAAIDFINGGRFDLVLLDLRLPEIGGDALLQFILEQKPDLPVVIASEEIDGEAMEALGRMGARGFIRKPYEADDLQVVVEQVLAEQDVMHAAARPEASAARAADRAIRSPAADPSKVAPGAGVGTLYRNRQPVIQTPAREHPRRVRKRKGSRLRVVKNYFLVAVLVALAGVIVWVVQQAFSGGFMGIGFTQHPPG